WARAVTDGRVRALAVRPGLRPLAYLPLDNPECAAAEYRRVRDQPGFAGVCGSAGGGSASLADARFEPLWELLSADERLLLLHPGFSPDRSEEHTSELQSREKLVCRLLLEKKK